MNKDNLQKIFNNFQKSQWITPVDQAALILIIYSNPYYLIATNGKKCSAESAGSVAISEKELKRNSVKQIKNLKQVKEKQGEMGLKNFIERQLSKRTGLKGYHGYFKFVDIIAEEL